MKRIGLPMLSRWSGVRLRSVGLLGLVVVAFLVFYAIQAPPLQYSPDSATYLNFSDHRTGGYPFFLAVLDGLALPRAAISTVQLIVYAVSVFILGIELLRFFVSPLPALLCVLALLGNPEVNRYHFAVLTESLFLSVSALFLAAALAYLRSGRALPLAAAALATGALIAIRPTGIAFVPALLALGFVPAVRRRGIAKLLLVAIVPLLAVMALEWGYYYAHHRGGRTSPIAALIFAKAGLAAPPGVIDPAINGEIKLLVERLEPSFGAIRRLIADAPNEPVRCVLLVQYEEFVRSMVDERKKVPITERDRTLMHIALPRLAHGAGSYFRNSLDHLYCMWTLGAMTTSERASLDAYLAERRPVPFEDTIRGSLAATRGPPAPFAVRWMMLGTAALLAAAALALIGGVFRLWALPRILAAAGLCGLAVHATLGLMAAAGVGIPRYLLGLWVPLAVGVILAAAWVWEVMRLRGVRSNGPGVKAAAV